jgi:DNA replication and repair protein RecF
MQANFLAKPGVRLARLRLQNFRNFEDETLELPPAGAAITGANGQGKTNLLEAIYYLAMFRSFRGVRDDRLIRFGAEFFRLEARLASDGGTRAVAAAVGRRGPKRVWVDGAEVERVSDAVGRLPAVIFTATDVEIVRGTPKERRRFLDVALSLGRPAYLHALQRYRRALGQRNEALRRGAGAAEVAAWDEALVRWGAVVGRERARWVAEHADAFEAIYASIAGGGRARIAYRPGWGAGDDGERPGPDAPADAWAAAYRSGLAGAWARDRARGFTTAGPHRDDLEMEVALPGGRWAELRTYGSGGEHRTAAIALRLVEGAWLREATGREPIALLDDVFGELDEERVRGILGRLGEGDGQWVVTAPRAADLAGRLHRDVAVLTVEAGRLRPCLSPV